MTTFSTLTLKSHFCRLLEVLLPSLFPTSGHWGEWSFHAQKRNGKASQQSLLSRFSFALFPREKKCKGSVQNESGVFLKVTSGQATLHFWQILASDTGCLRLWSPMEPHIRAARDVLLFIPRSASTCERGHSLASEL